MSKEIVTIRGLERNQVQEFAEKLKTYGIETAFLPSTRLFADQKPSFDLQLIYDNAIKSDILLGVLKKEFSSILKTANQPGGEGWLAKEDQLIALHPEPVVTKAVYDLVNQRIGKLFSHPAIDSNFRYAIKSISIKNKISPYYGRSYYVLRVELETNNRPLLMGQFEGLPENGPWGLFTSYLQGALEYEVASMLDLEYVYVFFDVNQATIDNSHLQRFETIDQLVQRGVTIDTSLLHMLCQKHGLEAISMIGLDISGPVPGMILQIEDLLRKSHPNSILDLFCGTGAYSKCFLDSNQSAQATLVDIGDLSTAKNQLLSHAKRCKFIKGDVFSLDLKQHYDLIIADPYDFQALYFCQKVVPKISSLCSIFMTSICYSENRSYMEFVRVELSKSFSKVTVYDSAEVFVAECHHT